MPSVRFIETAADKASPQGEVPSDGDEPVRTGQIEGARADSLCLEKFTVRLHPESFHSYRCDAPSLEVETTKNKMIDLFATMVSRSSAAIQRPR